MKVVLKRDVSGLGNENEVKNVSDGYARNYLIPRGLAVPASEGQLKAAREFAETQENKAARLRERSLEMVASLKEKPLRFKVKAGSTGRLYGSITSNDVANAISRVIGADFDKRWLQMDRPIRDTGEHVVEVKLAGGVRGQVNVVVTAEEE